MEDILGQDIYRNWAISWIPKDEFRKIRNQSEKIYNRQEVCCYKSHVKAIDAISTSNSEYGVIFEDDFSVEDSSHSTIEKLVDEFPNFDILFIGSQNPEYKGDHVSGNVFKVEQENFVPGAHAYIIKKESAKKILDSLKEINKPIDVKFHEQIINGNLNGYIVHPSIVGLSNLKSTLDHN